MESKKLNILLLETGTAKVAELGKLLVTGGEEPTIISAVSGNGTSFENLNPHIIVSGLSSSDSRLREVLKKMTNGNNPLPLVIFEDIYPGAEKIAEQIKELFPKYYSEENPQEKADSSISVKYKELFYRLDRNAVFTDVSASVKFITGYSTSELLGSPISSIIHHEDRHKFIKELLQAGRLGYISSEFRIMCKNGDTKWIHNSFFPENEKESLKGYHGLMVDVTRNKSLEEDLIKAKEDAEEINRFKNVFLANLSHELRTPLIAILGYAEILADELLEEEHREMAEAIAQSSNRFTKTLNLLLDLARIETGSVEVKTEEINLAGITEFVAKPFVQKARQKNLDFVVDIREENILAQIDRNMFKQVLENIINNAISYTSEGAVSVTVDKVRAKGRLFGEIKVEDTGIGIDSENLPKIFEPFRQISEGFNRNYEGTGLGLSITKHFVELMEGIITVRSELGRGTQFIIRFPVKAV